MVTAQGVLPRQYRIMSMLLGAGVIPSGVRIMLAMACAALSSGAFAVGVGQTAGLEFQVLLGANPIGTHRFDISDLPGGQVEVRSDARFNVRLLGVPVHSYRHQAVEQWEAGCLSSISALTQDGNKRLQVSGAKRGARFHLSGEPSVGGSECAAGYAYWDLGRLLREKQLLNPQTGKYDAIRMESLGQEQIVVRGQPVQTNRRRLYAGGLEIDLWHTLAGQWVQLESTTSTNRPLRYVLR